MTRFAAAILSLVILDGLARADVVVIVNRTATDIAFEAVLPAAARRSWTLASGELKTIPMRSSITISVTAPQPLVYELDANAAYFFKLAPDRKLVLEQIDLGGDATTRSGRDLGKLAEDKPTRIPVKILVDDDEAAVRQAWEERLRQRLDRAAEILRPLFQVQFEFLAAETWQSSDELHNLSELLREFEGTVKAEPARLAIGYTSQITVSGDDGLPEVTPAPLHSHLLLVERSPWLTEAERLEYLVHSLGHYLGAAHSPEPHSVMRTKLADGQARRRDYRITFDPVNALAAYLTAEEVRYRGIADFSQISPGTSLRLRQLYGVLNAVMPADPLAAQNLGLLKTSDAGPFATKPVPPARTTPRPVPQTVPGTITLSSQLTPIVMADARAILRRIRAVAQAEASQTPRRTGDALTEHYVREAAAAASALQSASEARVFLIAIGIGLDDSELLSSNPLFAGLCRTLETAEERGERLRVLGAPTMHGRRDLAQHFLVSAFLTGAFGEAMAQSAGIAKELLDARGGSGFSFADLAADRAGIVWAKFLTSRQQAMADVARSFTVADTMPSIQDLPEGLSGEAFVNRFGSVDDERFRRMLREIQVRIEKLATYRTATG